jgi:hypothetical protein
MNDKTEKPATLTIFNEERESTENKSSKSN